MTVGVRTSRSRHAENHRKYRNIFHYFSSLIERKIGSESNFISLFHSHLGSTFVLRKEIRSPIDRRRWTFISVQWKTQVTNVKFSSDQSTVMSFEKKRNDDYLTAVLFRSVPFFSQFSTRFFFFFFVICSQWKRTWKRKTSVNAFPISSNFVWKIEARAFSFHWIIAHSESFESVKEKSKLFSTS